MESVLGLAVNKLLRAKVAGSGALLLVTAAYHASGHQQIGARLASFSVPAELVGAVGALWLFFSWHLAVVGVAALAAAASGAAWLRPVVLFCGVVALGDFFWVVGLAGWFAGTVLLLLAALGLLVGGFMWRADSRFPRHRRQPDGLAGSASSLGPPEEEYGEMKRSDRLRDLALHLEWADAAVWRAVLESADAALDSKLGFLLHHIHTVQHAFLQIWRGEPLEIPGRGKFPDLPSLARWGREAHAGIQEYLAGADDADLGRELSIPWSEELEKQWDRPIGPVSLEQSAIQVAMHSTHHRGQIAARFRELGGEPPLVDFIAWVWWRRPEPEWPAALDAGGP